MGKMLYSLAALLTALCWLTGCSNVDVDSSSAGNQKLAAASSIYMEPTFPVSDESKGPGEKFDGKVHGVLKDILQGKGYTVAESAGEADIVLNGSYESGKVMSGSLVSSYGAVKPNAGAGNAYYLTLNALANGQQLWSANEPLAGDSLESVLAALMASFPESGK